MKIPFLEHKMDILETSQEMGKGDSPFLFLDGDVAQGDAEIHMLKLKSAASGLTHPKREYLAAL